MANIEKIVLKKKQIEEENKKLKQKIKELQVSLDLRDNEITRLRNRIQDARKSLGYGYSFLKNKLMKRKTKSRAVRR